MGRVMRSFLILGPALTVFGLTAAAAAAAADCSQWTLDGYRLGMRGDELLAVRSVTLHVEGQAQVIEPGKLQGVLVLDALNRLEKWDVRYDAANGEGLRAEMKSRFGEPISDVSGNISADESDPVRQRRTIWRSNACDALIIIYENTSASGTAVHAVNAILARPAILTPGLVEMKTLFH